MIFLKRFKRYNFQYKYDKCLYNGPVIYRIIQELFINNVRVVESNISKYRIILHMQIIITPRINKLYKSMMIDIYIDTTTNCITKLYLPYYDVLFIKYEFNYSYGLAYNLYKIKTPIKNTSCVNKEYLSHIVQKLSPTEFYIRDIDLCIDCKAYKLLK